MTITRFILCILSVALTCVAGCATHPDPLAGWQGDFSEQPSQAIVSDYQGFIQKLSPEKRRGAGIDDWLKDGTGQHAIVIRYGINGTLWEHVLIYDKDDKRIKTITKHTNGAYRS